MRFKENSRLGSVLITQIIGEYCEHGDIDDDDDDAIQVGRRLASGSTRGSRGENHECPRHLILHQGLLSPLTKCFILNEI